MLEGLQQAFGVTVDKSIEINDPADLTEAWLTAEARTRHTRATHVARHTRAMHVPGA